MHCIDIAYPAQLNFNIIVHHLCCVVSSKECRKIKYSIIDYIVYQTYFVIKRLRNFPLTKKTLRIEICTLIDIFIITDTLSFQ